MLKQEKAQQIPLTIERRSENLSTGPAPLVFVLALTAAVVFVVAPVSANSPEHTIATDAHRPISHEAAEKSHEAIYPLLAYAAFLSTPIWAAVINCEEFLNLPVPPQKALAHAETNVLYEKMNELHSAIVKPLEAVRSKCENALLVERLPNEWVSARIAEGQKASSQAKNLFEVLRQIAPPKGVSVSMRPQGASDFVTYSPIKGYAWPMVNTPSISYPSSVNYASADWFALARRGDWLLVWAPKLDYHGLEVMWVKRDDFKILPKESETVIAIP
jgi:hypothetical protein